MMTSHKYRVIHGPELVSFISWPGAVRNQDKAKMELGDRAWNKKIDPDQANNRYCGPSLKTRYHRTKLLMHLLR